ncbi:hypothetical protein LDK25_05920 [Fusobacterium nucleatum]|uniref:hypothetical protein n=1 Tax=Fusobacterium nucleatum TaxID=851 RepID=UPI0030EE658F
MKNRKELLRMVISHFISIFSSLFLLTSILFAIILTFSAILYQFVKIAGIFTMFLLTTLDNQNPVFKIKILLKNFILASIYIFFLGILLYINIMIFEYVESIFYIGKILKVKEIIIAIIIAIILGIMELGISYLFISFWVRKIFELKYNKDKK